MARRNVNKNTPTVSVIIPTHNRAHLISRAIRSVLEQTFQDLEVIVVDDGSTDGTEEAVKVFTDPRLRFIRHERNRGGSAARNTGIRAARGEYIAFLDSDDEWLPGKLAEQLRVFAEDPDCGAVYTDILCVYRDGTVEAPPLGRRPEGRILRHLLASNIVGTTSSVMVKRCCFEVAGLFDEALPSCQDWDMWIKIARHYGFRSIPRPLVRYRWHEVQISKDAKAFRRGHEAIIEKYRAEIRALGRRVHGLHYFRLGRHLCRYGEMRAGRKHLWRAVAICPYHPRYCAHALAALFGAAGYRSLIREKRMPGGQDEPPGRKELDSGAPK